MSFPVLVASGCLPSVFVHPAALSHAGLTLAVLTTALVTKSSLFGIGIAFSPLYIAVVALLLLGKAPLKRAMAYVSGWALANALAIVVLTVLGETFSISLNHGEREQVLIDLLGAGALVGLGLYQLTPQANIGEEGMALRLMNQLPDFNTVTLVLIGATSALLTPENLVFYLKEASLLLLNEPGLKADAEVTGLFTLVASSLLLLPPLAWLVSRGAIREPIARLENWLQHKAEWLVGVLALALGAYLLYEGLHGLDVMRSP
ncbi:MAG: GAP family protein [Cyanobacteria bacterium]|nr:GAP family protein [Cyanobacteriota bacterium]